MQCTQYNYEMKSENSELSYYHQDVHAKQTDNEIDHVPDINYENLITEDDTPVDNFFCEKQLRLLPESLKSSWNREKSYIVAADVGIYEKIPDKPIVPDVFLSLDVQYADNIWEKKNRCYMIGIFGKPPELVIEVVSNKVGQENTTKKEKYASMGIKYYAIFDPDLHILPTKLYAYQLINNSYILFPKRKENDCVWFEDLNIGLTIHDCFFEGVRDKWLRWCDSNGNILLTGIERSEVEKKRADAEKNRADTEKNRADALEKELAKLKAQMIEKNKIL